MARILRVAVSLIVLGAVLAPPARAADDTALAGVYVSNGVNPDGSSYKGIVHIARHGDSFIVTWLYPRSENEALILIPTAFGIGIVDGAHFAVSYGTSSVAGLVVYRIEDEGRRLVGRWVVAGSDGLSFVENLTKVAAEAPDTRPADSPPGSGTPARPKFRPPVADRAL
jgi:hypothetical protein